ncbi:nickel pincer cofactor biosynthesis protein LarB [Marispirochaeta sp.]|uniref:nickel pincer cofactor biosynthesis protein LarB n=1 Tax=Marispirochaeta sp. TaxID=2038653 RepID=UPI0029C6F7DB|nr:nickel pincer cofactor biosynthesis protein LarB [Marispirochaeta sp.]
MNTNDRLEELLTRFSQGETDLDCTQKAVQDLFFTDLGHTRLDTHRRERTGYPEVIYCAGKTADQIREIMGHMRNRGINVLATRMSEAVYEELKDEFSEGHYTAGPGIFTIVCKPTEKNTKGEIAVVSAGTSDFRVAEEAALTAEFYGHAVARYSDVGVAGIHRLLASIDDIRRARVIVVVAGMEGALASVVAGLVQAPIIAVPTSVGYGANFQGLTALLSMINSCSAGISVVNIDNGFGAGFLAGMINAL